MSKKQASLYPLKVINQLAKLPKTVHSLHTTVSQLQAEIAALKADSLRHSTEIQNVMESDKVHDDFLHRIDKKVTNLQRKGTHVSNNSVSTPVVNNTISDDHSLDDFYKDFEDKFRGSEELIKERVAEHMPLFNKLPQKIKSYPIVDIGCGRGEFLGVLADNGFTGIGVDMNDSMVERAVENGYEAHVDNAQHYLASSKQDSMAAITGFHIVEHIPFGILIDIFRESYRAVAPGGFVLFETPNPQNLSVGACNFYMDPSHIKPIPPELLAFAIQSVGFKATILPLHPAKTKIVHKDPKVKDMMNMLYGPLDYAVVGYKP